MTDFCILLLFLPNKSTNGVSVPSLPWRQCTHPTFSALAMQPSLAQLLKHHHLFCNTCSQTQGLFQASFLIPQKDWNHFLLFAPAEPMYLLSVAASSSAFCAHFFYSSTDGTSWSSCFLCSGTATFSSRTFPMAQLSLPALSSPCCCSGADTQCTDLSCFRAVQEILRSPFLPLCSSNELCDATQLLIFSRVVAGEH